MNGRSTETTRHFDRDPGSARGARQFVDLELRDRTDPDLLQRLLLVVSELATNAVRHADSSFELTIHADGVIRITVADASPDVPVVRHAALTDTSGRGLVILEHCCARWGVEPHDNGKDIWCEIDRAPSTDQPA